MRYKSFDLAVTKINLIDEEEIPKGLVASLYRVRKETYEDENKEVSIWYATIRAKYKNYDTITTEVINARDKSTFLLKLLKYYREVIGEYKKTNNLSDELEYKLLNGFVMKLGDVLNELNYSEIELNEYGIKENVLLDILKGLDIYSINIDPENSNLYIIEIKPAHNVNKYTYVWDIRDNNTSVLSQGLEKILANVYQDTSNSVGKKHLSALVNGLLTFRGIKARKPVPQDVSLNEDIIYSILNKDGILDKTDIRTENPDLLFSKISSEDLEIIKKYNFSKEFITFKINASEKTLALIYYNLAVLTIVEGTNVDKITKDYLIVINKASFEYRVNDSVNYIKTLDNLNKITGRKIIKDDEEIRDLSKALYYLYEGELK